MMNNFKSYKWFGGMASLAILLFLSACTKDPSFEKKEEAYLTVSPKTLTFKPSADSQELTVEASGQGPVYRRNDPAVGWHPYPIGFRDASERGDQP